jgi:hypothetical protein
MVKKDYTATPNDSRYVPFTQQPYLCVPTCIQIVMYKNNIPLIPAEEIGYYLGLSVPPEFESSFFKARVFDTPPVSSGYGTRIQLAEYEPNQAFKKLGIPLIYSTKLSSQISNADEMIKELISIQDNNDDVLLCFNPGVLYRNEYKPLTGHVVVFDRIIDGKIRFIDPDHKLPKWGYVEPTVLLAAIKAHGDENSGGMWYLSHAL